MSPVLTTREVAKHFHRSADTIRKWAKSGCPRPIAGTRPLLFPADEIKRRENQLRRTEIY